MLRTTGLLTSASALIFASTAGAQTVATVEEIIVTAQKRAQSINEVGISINAYTGDNLRDRGIVSAEQMSQVTPGLTVNDTGMQGTPIYTIRGVGFSNPYANASSTVGLYLDEVAIPYTVTSRGAIFDMERIEVLKGPQGDLYGRNTTAGQINFITRKPTKEFVAGISGEYARFNAIDLEGYVSGPISNKVQGRLSGKYVKSDGWQRSASRPDDKKLGGLDQISLRGQLNFDLSDNATFLLKAHYVRDKSENVAPMAIDGLEVGMPSSQGRPTSGPAVIYSSGDNRLADWTPRFRPQRDNELYGFAARLDIDIGGISFTSLTGYDHFTRSETNDWDGALTEDSQSINDTDLDIFSQEIRFSSNTEGPFTWILGGYYSYDKMVEDYNYFMGNSAYSMAPLFIQELDTRFRQKTESYAGFLHLEYELSNKFRLVGGARYTVEKRDFFGCTYDRDGTLADATNNFITPVLIVGQGLPDPGLVAPGGCAVYDDRVDSANFGTFEPFSEDMTTKRWMWKAGINYDVTDSTLLFASFSSGFKSGGFNGANANTQTQLNAYRPEKLNAYEIGMKSTLLDGRMQFNLSGFYYDYRDKQENGLAVTFVGNISGITNIEKSRVYGVEAEVNLALSEGFMVNAGLAYLDTKVTKWNRVDSSSAFPNVVMVDETGQPLPNAPEWSFNVSPTYRWDASDRLYMEVGADVIYRGSTRVGPEAFQMIDSYWLTNLRLSLAEQTDRWRVSVWGKNVFNEYYFTHAGQGGNGPYVRVVGMPATYGLRLDYKF